jgi:hypothetical protein
VPGEGFSVDPAHVAGYGALARTSAVDSYRISGFVENNARSDGGFSGLMSALSGPVDAYADKAHDRFHARGQRLGTTDTELKRTAWRYTDIEESVWVIFGGGSPPTEIDIRDFPDAVAYPPGTDIEGMLEAPEVEAASLEEAIDETGGTLEAIDDVVRTVTGWSPVEEIVEPLSGRWPSLQQKAEVLRITGEASEQIAANLTTSLPTLDSHWNGGAAQAFVDHITGAARALEYEGPLNRVVAEVYDLIAAKIEEVAGFMVDVLGVAADRIRNALASVWIPGANLYRAYDAIRTAWDIFNEAKRLVEDIREAIDQVRAVIEAAQDPVGAAEDWLREELAPVTEAAEDTEQAAQWAEDLEVLSDPTAMTDEPTTPYRSGEDPRRPGE